MARLPNGILGELIGKAGPVSGYMRYGQNIIRSRRTKRVIAVTHKQLVQQQKIKVCNAFTNAFSGTGFFNKTFPAYGHTGSGYNRVTSAILNLAITGTYPGTALSFPHVLISKGPLPAAENATAAADNDGNLLFTWLPNIGMGTAKADDKVILVAYFPGKNMAIFSENAGARETGNAVLQTAIMKGETAHTWTGFLSADEKDASCSAYTGSITL